MARARATAAAAAAAVSASAVVLFALVCCGAATAVAANLQVALPGLGVAEGQLKNGAREFLGLPYAAPPVGPQGRWRPPQPPVAWQPAIYNATYYRPSCMQDRDFCASDPGMVAKIGKPPLLHRQTR